MDLSSWVFVFLFGVKTVQIIPALVAMTPSSWLPCPCVGWVLPLCSLVSLLSLFCGKHFLPFWNILWAHFVCFLPKSCRQSFPQGEGYEKQGLEGTKVFSLL